MRVMGCDDWANSRSREGLVGGEVVDQLGEREWRVGVGDVCWKIIHFIQGRTTCAGTSRSELQ